ncbi:MAG: NAD(P)H-hydrate dehydratase [Actinomycetota bacterium]
MRIVVTPRAMAAADRAAIDSGVPSLDLMERAGAAVASAVIGLAGGAYGRRIAVVCGKGNNAGDGFVAARYLAARGARPAVILLDDALGGDALINLRRLRAVPTMGPEALIRELGRADVVVDGIVGTGIKGALRSPASDAAEAINAAGKAVVAVDIPSGVEGATGQIHGPAVRADVTVTMAALKIGLLLHPGSAHAGRIEVAEIGIADHFLHADLLLAGAGDVARVLPPRPPLAHKRSVGTVLIVAGSLGMAGAAALAARGALRAGAGLVTMAVPGSLARGLDQTVLEATTLPLPETPDGTIESSAVDLVLDHAARNDCVALGPGLSTDPETVTFVHKLVASLERPIVIDADALNALAGATGILASRSTPTLLTPHPGELARLLGTGTAEVSADRLWAVRRAAVSTKAAVLLKGYRTLVAEPGGDCVLVATGGPALATGGSGDVLTGVTGAFLASGMEAADAGWAGAWVHGRAGDVVAARRGVRGTIAGDLPEAVAEVLTRLAEDGEPEAGVAT